MEIVPIIYKFLLIGGAILTLIIVISFLLSKSSRREEKKALQQKRLVPQPMYFYHNTVQAPIQHQPVIFPIDGSPQREIKVVRKHSYEELDNSNRTTGNVNGRNGTRRYTILNDEIKNSNYRYVNEA
jgi:hypothetical protein